MGWDAGQAVSSGIKLIAKVANSHTSSEIIGNESGWADNFHTFSLGSVKFIPPNTFNTSSSNFFESLAKRVNVDTIKSSVDELSFSTSLCQGDAFSIDSFFSRADATCTKTSVGTPFSAFVINFVASPSGRVEVSSSSARKWGSVAYSVVESVSNGALGTFGEIVISVTSDRVGKALTISFVLASRAVVFKASSVDKGVSGVALLAGIDSFVVEDTGESGEIRGESASSEDSCDIGVVFVEWASIDDGGPVHSEGVSDDSQILSIWMNSVINCNPGVAGSDVE